jgi:hypothetical protein
MNHGFKEMGSTNRWEKCNTSRYDAICNLLKLTIANCGQFWLSGLGHLVYLAFRSLECERPGDDYSS